MVMGKVTAAGSYQGQYAPSILGLLTQGYGGATTTICVAAATAAEIVRRIGSTGTLNLTGPIAAGGTVRTIQAAYTAVNTGTGAVTLSAALGTAAVNAVNQVNTVAVTGTASAGTIQFTIEGTTTGTAAYGAVWATFPGQHSGGQRCDLWNQCHRLGRHVPGGADGDFLGNGVCRAARRRDDRERLRLDGSDRRYGHRDYGRG